jgi:NhaP-type Na+/H+ or K+/H+ antiporter
MELFSLYNLIIEASIIVILSFLFNELAKRTNIPSVLMLILLGILLKYGLEATGIGDLNLIPILEFIGTVGLIMIVLEAALELELERDKMIPIAKALAIALIGLLGCTYIASLILQYFFSDMTASQAFLYATPISILSSAIIIPSVSGLTQSKKEFHIYEATFSDILGILLFYFLIGEDGTMGTPVSLFSNIGLTVVVSVIGSYVLVILFQQIKSHTKLFLLISVLLLLYALGKKMHLSSLIIILIFGLMIANMELFFKGKLANFLHVEKAKSIYEGLHVLTLETSFIVRTFFFVIFGLTISVSSIFDWKVALVSLLIIMSIYLIRYILLRLIIGLNIHPQLYIAPRGLVTVLLFYAIPKSVQYKGFEPGILLFIILGTSLIMTWALIKDKNKTMRAINLVNANPVENTKWIPPNADDIETIKEEEH